MKSNKNNKQMLFEMMGKIDSTFQPQVSEEYNVPTHDEDPYGLVVKAVRSGFITPDEYFKDAQTFITAAQETAENWSNMEEIGSSDMTFMLKEFLADAGIETEFINGKLTRKNHPLREEKELVVSEDINIDVEVGDTIMTGRFKNSPRVVKTIGKDEHGMPTINGMKVVTFRKATEKNKK